MVGAYVATYLTIGVIWCLWSPKFLSYFMEKMYTEDSIVWLFIGLLIGSIIWPIGLAGNIILWTTEIFREGRKRNV